MLEEVERVIYYLSSAECHPTKSDTVIITDDSDEDDPTTDDSDEDDPTTDDSDKDDPTTKDPHDADTTTDDAHRYDPREEAAIKAPHQGTTGRPVNHPLTASQAQGIQRPR